MFPARLLISLLLSTCLASGSFGQGAGAVFAVRGEDPSMGLISRFNQYWLQCGGTVLGPKLVFTAGDCCAPKKQWWIIEPILPIDFFFTAGATQLTAQQNQNQNQNQTLDKGPIQTRSSRFYIHPEKSEAYKNNYCILELDTPLTFSGKDLAPADLYYSEGPPKVDTTLIIFRWASAYNGQPSRMTLEKVECAVTSPQVCRKYYPGADVNSTFCCMTQEPNDKLDTEANQIMFRNATGHLLLVGHQLAYPNNPVGDFPTEIGLFNLANRVSDWIKTAALPKMPMAVGRGEDPSMGLIYGSKVPWTCGGTVVGPKWVFTAADCCLPGNYSYFGGKPETFSPDDLRLAAGSIQHSVCGTTIDNPVQIRGSRFYVHPEKSGAYKNNYCMLELDTPLTLSGNDLTPADLYYSEGPPKVGATFVVYRWTTLDNRPPYRMTLERVACTVMIWEECLKKYPGADATSTFCCNTPSQSQSPDARGRIESSQLMFQNATGHLLLVGHQLNYGNDPTVELFNLANRVTDWIKNPRPPTPTTPRPTVVTTSPINPATLAAARVEADLGSLTSKTLTQFSEKLGQYLYSWYAARYFNWTRLLLVNTPKDLPAKLENLRREIGNWERISNLSGNGLLPRPSLIAVEVGKNVNEIIGDLTPNRTKTSILVELESIKALDKRELDSVYGRPGLTGVNTTHWLGGPFTRNLILTLRTGLNWLEFLQLTLQTLSAGPIQSGSKTDLVTKIGRCDLPDTNLLNCFTNIIQTFQKSNSNSNLTPAGTLQTFKALNPTVQQVALRDLNGIIEVTLKENTLSCTYDASSLTLVARGRFVTLSSILNGNGTGCVRALSQGRVKNLVIFATSTFFIDSDVRGVDISGREGEPLSLTIFAPWWEVNPRNSSNNASCTPWMWDLRGADGQDAASTKPGKNVLGVGLEGASGGPGQNGGNLQIMGQGLYPPISGVLPPPIYLLLNGGVGGRGQPGGDGANGVDGKGAEFPTEKDIYDIHPFNATEYVKRYPVPCEVTRENLTLFCPHSTRLCYVFTCRGFEGTPGGNGGGGGKGGVGGNLGVFNDYLGYPGIYVTGKLTGNSGQVGKAGYSGVLSKKGPRRFIVYEFIDGGFFPSRFNRTRDEYDSGLSWLLNTTSNRGPPACDGCSTLNPVAPPPSTLRNRYWSGYLAFALEAPQLLNLYSQSSLFRFIEKVEGLAPFQLSREPLEPFQDLQSIEIGAARLEKEKGAVTGAAGLILAPPDLSPLLNAFLAKVYYLASTVATPGIQHPRRHIPVAEYRKALFSLYTAAYSRLESFSDLSSEPLLVVNVAGYLSYAAAAFRDLQISQQNLQRLALIDRTNEVYQEDIRNKFQEANLFIQLVLSPGLEKSLQQIDRSTDDLVTEIVKLQNSTNANLQALQALEKNLQTRAPLMALTRIFTLIGSGLAVFGAKGQIAGAVMNLVGGAAEAAMMAGTPSDVPTVNIPLSISAADTELAKNLSAKNEEAIKTYRAQLDYISTLLKQDGSADSAPLQKEVTTIKARLQEYQTSILIDVGSNSLLALEASTNFTTLHRETQATLSAAFNTALRPTGGKAQGRKKRWNLVDTVGRAERINYVGIDTYAKYRGDLSKLEVVAKQIFETKQALVQLEVQKENVESVMKPVLVQMRADLDRARQSMANQSAIALTVSQWQTQQMLRTLKTELRQMFTAGFSNLDNSLAAAFDNLQETMTTLTNVYDKLETLQGQSKLANLVSKSQSAALTSVIVNDPDLNRALNNLNGVIQSVVVSEQYDFALKSFNTWIFPFARFFSAEFQLPSQMQSLMMNASQTAAGGGGAALQINGSMNAEAFVQRLLDTVGTRLDKLRLKMGEYMTTVMAFDKVLIPKAQFYRPRPFYTWPASQFSSQISSLLRGERVSLIADVRASDEIFHAVKFRKIRLEFGVAGNLTGATPQIVNDYLGYFTIRLVHTGNSGFRYGYSYFNVMTPSLPLEYRYSPPGTPYPIDENGVYDKVMSGDLSLSPYTLWDVQISPQRPGIEKIPGFQEVMKIAGARGLDLHLVGEGSRVTTDRYSEEQLQLEMFYNKETM